MARQWAASYMKINRKLNPEVEVAMSTITYCTPWYEGAISKK